MGLAHWGAESSEAPKFYYFEKALKRKKY